MYTFISILTLSITCSAMHVEVKSESNRISNGDLADNLQFPYVVSIQQIVGNEDSPTRGHRCGGVLITYQHVLTAASCFYEGHDDETSFIFSSYRVFAGSNLLTNDTSDDNVRQIRMAVSFKDYFGFPAYLNDILVFELNTPFPGSTVVPISIASATYSLTDYTVCTIAGWGAPTYNETVTASTELRYASRYIYNQNLCTIVYNTQEGTPNIHPSMVCAASYDILSTGCVGDQGSALVCDNTVVGILTWHNNCKASSFPELYTRVSDYSDRIRMYATLAEVSDSASAASTFNNFRVSLLTFLTSMLFIKVNYL